MADHHAAHHAAAVYQADADHQAHHAHHMQLSSSLQHDNFHSDSISGHGQGPTHYSDSSYKRKFRRFVSGFIIIGLVMLAISITMIICGVLNFVGVIKLDTSTFGIPMLGAGGVILFGGLAFTCMGCTSLATSKLNQDQQRAGEGHTNPLPEQLTDNAGFNQPPSNVGLGQPTRNVGFNEQNLMYNAGYDQTLSNTSFPSASLPAYEPPPYSETAHPGSKPTQSSK